MSCSSESLVGFKEKRVSEEVSIEIPRAEVLCSRLDKDITISKEQWAVTLIVDANSHHARLIFEGLDKISELWTIFVHLTGDSSGLKRLFQDCSGAVEMKDITGKVIKFGERSETWEVSANSGRRVIQYIQPFCSKYFDPESPSPERAVLTNNASPKSVPFFITGNQSLFTRFFNRYTKREFHSCITFSLHLLKKMGITFENPPGVVFTDTLDFIRQTNAKFKKKDMGLNDLCWFIVDNDIEDIREHFSKTTTNVNQIITFHPDSQEVLLKNVSPLMVAILHSREDIIRILVEEYDADVEFARNDGLTPLFIARAIAKLPREHSIVKLLLAKGAKNYLAEKRKGFYAKRLNQEGIYENTQELLISEEKNFIKALSSELSYWNLDEVDASKIKSELEVEELAKRLNLFILKERANELVNQLKIISFASRPPEPEDKGVDFGGLSQAPAACK